MTRSRVHGFCPLCRSRCGCVSVVEDGKLVAVDPDPGHPTGAALCIKGKAAPELVNSEERLLHPVRRTRAKGASDPGWERVSWEEALEWTAANMNRAAREAGPESVAFAVTSPSGAAISDSIVWIERLVRLFGSPNTIYSTEICNWHKDFAAAYTFGVGIPAPDFANAGCILLWGHNPATTWLMHARLAGESRRRGAKLVVVDPRRVGLARQADEWVRVRPGTDGALALGIAAVMIEHGWYDDRFVRAWTTAPFLVREDTNRFLRPDDLSPEGASEGRVAWDSAGRQPVVYSVTAGRYEHVIDHPLLEGRVMCETPAGAVACRPAFDLYSALCRTYPPDRVEQITSVPVEQLMRVAQLLYENRPVAYYAWSGVGQHTNATQTDRAISLLYALTGSFDAPGGNVVYERPRVNEVAGLDLLGDSQLEKAIDRRARPLGPARNGWVPGHSFARSVLTRDPYPIRGLVGFGSNLLLSQPDPELMRRALTDLDFFVQCDMFMTPTAELADVVLPVSSGWEREGLRVGFEVTQEAEQLVQLRPRVVAPRGDARSDMEIVFDLAGRLGLRDRFFGGEIDEGYRAMLAPSGVTLEQLRESPAGVRVPLRTRYRKYAERDGAGHVGFRTPSRRVELYLEEFLEHGQDPLPQFVHGAVSAATEPGIARSYPLTLTTAKALHFCHSQHRSLPRLRKPNPDPLVDVHPTAARDRGIADGEWVVVETAQGSMRARARLNPELLPDVVCAQFGWWQACPSLDLPGYEASGPASANYNGLIGADAADPISGSTPLRSYLCEIRSGKR